MDNRTLHRLNYSDGLLIEGVAYDILLGRDVNNEDIAGIRESKKYGPGLSRLTLLLSKRPPMFQPQASQPNTIRVVPFSRERIANLEAEAWNAAFQSERSAS